MKNILKFWPARPSSRNLFIMKKNLFSKRLARLWKVFFKPINYTARYLYIMLFVLCLKRIEYYSYSKLLK